MYRVLFAILVVGLFLHSPARGQDNSSNQQPVTRQEIEQLKKENVIF